MPPKNDLPKNWPPSVPYLRTPTYSKVLSSDQLKALRIQPEDALLVPPSTPLGPSPLVRIQPINDPSHPACGQNGLFATKDLAPGSFVLCYIGEIHGSRSQADQEKYGTSDYDLSIDRENDLAVDASRSGNEARFVNDFRGVPASAASPLPPKFSSSKSGKEKPGKALPNAEFREIWDGRPGRGERCMGVFVLPAGKAKKNVGIKKGEEILVSYGRGFWGARIGGEDEVDWEARYAEDNGES